MSATNELVRPAVTNDDPSSVYRNRARLKGRSLDGGFRRAFLATLRCPYSGGAYAATDVQMGSDDSIRFGVIKSEAGEFPVIQGIARIMVDELRASLVALLKAGRQDAALRLALDVPFSDRGGAITNFATRMIYARGTSLAKWGVHCAKQRLYRTMTDPNLTFMELVARLGSEHWTRWQVGRFAMPTFLPQFALAPLAIPNMPVLDFGSGVGHGAFLLSRESPQHIVCADYSFSSLYLAQRYFVPEADFVCMDGDFPLPFASKYFGSVYSSDALHCLDSKVTLTAEFKRVTKSDGIIVLPHLHNLLSNVRFGKSLSPTGYAALFDDMHVRVLPEDTVLADFAQRGLLDLHRTYPLEALNNAKRGLCLVATRDRTLLRQIKDLWEHRLQRLQAPMINPVYRIEVRGAQTRLIRGALDASGAELVALGLLPESVVMPFILRDRVSLKDYLRAHPTQYNTLVRQLVIVDGPPEFS